MPWYLLWQVSINFNLFLRTLNVPVLKLPMLCVFNKRPKDTTKKYGWLYLHCTYYYLRCWKNLALCSSDPSLSCTARSWMTERVWDRREGVGTRLLWPYTIPPCFAIKSCSLWWKLLKSYSKKKKTFCYPLHLFNMKQQYANFKTKLRISKHFCSILGVAI